MEDLSDGLRGFSFFWDFWGFFDGFDSLNSMWPQEGVARAGKKARQVPWLLVHFF